MKYKLSFAVGLAALALFAFGTGNSGLAVGENTPAFDPKHLTGPDKGTSTCPVCKYGARPAAQVWVNGDDLKNVAAIAATLDKAMKDHKSADFRAFVVVLTSGDSKKLESELVSIATANKLNEVAFTVLPKTDDAVSNYKVNTGADIKNTVFVYKDRKVTAKFVNLDAAKGKAQLDAAIAKVAP